MEERLETRVTEFERAMPFSREAEQSVLGAMLLDAQCIPDATNICKADDFYIDNFKTMWYNKFVTQTEYFGIGVFLIIGILYPFLSILKFMDLVKTQAPLILVWLKYSYSD